jgi:hypothetical protein
MTDRSSEPRRPYWHLSTNADGFQIAEHFCSRHARVQAIWVGDGWRCTRCGATHPPSDTPVTEEDQAHGP